MSLSTVKLNKADADLGSVSPSSLPEPQTVQGLKVVLWLELLHHFCQLVDQLAKGDPVLRHLLPAPEHQHVHLLNMNCDGITGGKHVQLRYHIFPADTTSI